ncbi:MAG: futalosine hydrolase [Desulfuromonas sp.]|nr:MAG: futalosine hydrolase [Desulfuromonas sp.]
MIALIAAHPLETTLLQRQLSPCEVLTLGGSSLYRGRLHGQNILLFHCGVGKAAAAAAVTELLLTYPVETVILFGCGGAYLPGPLRVGDLALASEEYFGDEGVITPDGFLDMEALNLPLLERKGERYFNALPVTTELLEQAFSSSRKLTERSGRRIAVGRFVTVSSCSGSDAQGELLQQRCDGICENMEGAAVARICLLRQVPFLEIRGISNLVENRDPRRWDLEAGCTIAQQAVLELLDSWANPRGSA